MQNNIFAIFLVAFALMTQGCGGDHWVIKVRDSKGNVAHRIDIDSDFQIDTG